MQDEGRGHGRIFPLLPWPFESGRFPENLAAIVHKAVGDGRVPARYVLHDEDGYWHVTDGSADLTADDLAVDAVRHTVVRNAAMAGLADLPPGWAAVYDESTGTWRRFPNGEEPAEDTAERPPAASGREAWEDVVRLARERAAARQRKMVETHGLAGDVQYEWSMDDALMRWSRQGRPFLTARITMIGSVSLPRRTWLWSWANSSLPAAVLGDIARVRDYGEANGYPVLPWKGFEYDPALVAEARQVSAAVLDAEGLWMEKTGDTQLHFLLHDLTLIDPDRP